MASQRAAGRIIPLYFLAAGALFSAASLPSDASANVLGKIGRFLGKPLGAFIEAATTPTLQSGEATAQRLVADVDTRLGTRLTQVSSLESTTNQDIKSRLSQADGIMAARIAQVDVAADARIAQVLGGVQDVEQKAVSDAQKLVGSVNQDAKDRIDQLNQVATSRINQIDGVVHNAIAQADEDAQARIAQLDDVAAVRLGSVDLIATKLSLNLQVTLLKVGALLGMVAFIVYAVSYLFKHVPDSLKHWAESKPDWSSTKRGAVVTATSAGWFLGHVAVGAVVVGLLAMLAHRLPVGAKKQIDDLTTFQVQTLQNSYATLDFDRVRYSAAQLAILDPSNELEHRSLQAGAELVRAAFMRPGLFTSPEGIRQLSDQIGLTEQAHEAAETHRDGTDAAGKARSQADAAYRALLRQPDSDQALTRQSPDVLVVACYAQWQLAQNRNDELTAVTSCARALAIDRSLAQVRSAEPALSASEPFLLAPVAAHYLGLYLASAPESYPSDAAFTLETLGELAKGAPEPATFPPFASAIKYDALVLDLDRDTTTGFIALLDAHAKLGAALVKQPKSAKRPKPGADKHPSEAESAVTAAQAEQEQAAQALIGIWQRFDAALDSAPELVGTPLTLSALSLNDVPLSHAFWFKAHPDVAALPPRIADETDLATRIGMAPIRIAWVRRYLKTLSPEVQQLVAEQESTRFEQDQDATMAFEQAYTAYRIAVLSGAAPDAQAKLRDSAALAAGKLGLYTRQKEQPVARAFGLVLLAEGSPASPQTQQALASAYAATRLRLL
jgi:hypothetical protein